MCFSLAGTWSFHIPLSRSPHSPLVLASQVCLSLLGTWSGPSWDPSVSSLEQVLISIQSMIFCEQPYANEPGYASMENTPMSTSYNMFIRWADALPKPLPKHMQHHGEVSAAWQRDPGSAEMHHETFVSGGPRRCSWRMACGQRRRGACGGGAGPTRGPALSPQVPQRRVRCPPHAEKRRPHLWRSGASPRRLEEGGDRGDPGRVGAGGGRVLRGD